MTGQMHALNCLSDAEVQISYLTRCEIPDQISCLYRSLGIQLD